jgi:hypothetical protein
MKARLEEQPMTTQSGARPLYLGSEETPLANYYPAWLDNLADDVTVEGSLLDGALQGPEVVRSVVVAIRSLYDHQEHTYAQPYSETGFLEVYRASVRGEPIGCVVLVTKNAAGKTQRLVVSYRPRSSLLLLSRLLHDKFAGTPTAEYFAASESTELAGSTALPRDEHPST